MLIAKNGGVWVHVARTEWPSWRGSKGELVRVMDAALEQASQAGKQPATCEIDVEVKGDREGFPSPQQFKERVTSEALRQFQSIQVNATGPGIDVHFEMCWHGASWWPDRSARVALTVSGDNEARVEDAAAKVRAAVGRAARGHLRYGLISETVDTVITYVVVGALTVALALLWRVPLTSIAGAILLIPALVVVGYIKGSLYPRLEVSAEGSSKLVRLRGLWLGFLWSLIGGLVAKVLERFVLG